MSSANNVIASPTQKKDNNVSIEKTEDGLTIRKTHYKNGTIKSEVSLKDGKREGLEKTYYENGKLQTKVSYKNGKENGIKQFYKKDDI